MAKKKNDNQYYAVIRGREIDIPTIFPSWSHVQPLVTGFKKNIHQAFVREEEAISWLNEKGCYIFEYHPDMQKPNTKTLPDPAGPCYGVAHGQPAGIYHTYADVKNVADYVPHACHQKFNSREKAEEAGKVWRETAARVNYEPPRSKPSCRQASTGGLANQDAVSDLAALMKESHLSGGLEIKNEVGLESA